MLPDGPLLAYYGDDFTGSTDVLEVMSFSGLPTALLLDEVTPARLREFQGYRGIGLAGIARSKSPAWMDAHLPGLLEPLFALNAPLTHYKICSTFDSSPQVGSIGRAIDIALPRAAESWSPMVVAAPRLNRYQAFGNLFAGIGRDHYRLDRHPVMSRHPITPMREADLMLHLGVQTSRPIGLVDLAALKSRRGAERLQQILEEGNQIVLFDAVDEETLAEAGRLIWENRGRGLFSASSSGLQYALTAYWRSQGWIGPLEAPPDSGHSDGPILVVSGSCSAVTGEQIQFALDNGFEGVRLNGPRLAQERTRQKEIEAGLERASAGLSRGSSVILFTALSRDDPAIAELTAFCAQEDLNLGDAQIALGSALGTVAVACIVRFDVRRVLVMGGDTAGRVVAKLPIHALTARTALAPGAPVCRAHSDDPRFEGIEVILRGGQVGGRDLVVRANK